MNPICLRCIPRWIAALCAVAFALSGWAGWSLFKHPAKIVPAPAPPPKKETFALRFFAYNVQGVPLSHAKLVSQDGHPVDTELGPGCEITEPVGAKQLIEFRYKNTTQSEQVEWRSGDAYKSWIEAELPRHLASIDPKYDRKRWRAIMDNLQINAIHGTYPVLFRER
jgi:hypothetical protein